MTRHTSRGLTLLELLVVLVILVAVAAVAVQSAGGLVDQGRYDASRRALTATDEAAVGRAGTVEPDGTRLVDGFVADIGRLPVVTLDTDGDPTAGGLLAKPATIASFGLKSAPTVSYSGTHGSFTVETGGFPVAAGWRGPYLRLPVGATVLRDGWGNKLDWLDATGAALTAGDAGSEIAGARANGADGSPGATSSDPYDADIDVTWKAASVDRVSATLSGSVKTSTGGATSDPVSGDVVFVLLFGPDPSTGGVLVTHTGGTGAALTDTATITASPWTYSYATTIGPRALRAYVYRAGTLHTGPLVRLRVTAGGQVKDLVVEIP